MSAPRKDPRAFVLIIVAVCGAAMLVIAMAVVVTSGSGQLNAIKDVNSDRSNTIAESGLQRATAYANAIIRFEKDFDRALDPALAINCASPPSAVAPGTPRYSDGSSTVQWPPGSGIEYAVVPFNEGAYLTRFDDDFDDSLPNSQLGAFSGNNPVNGCAEGPGIVNNPYRDRNRAVWISVIGIYPGTNPAAAKHHTALRRFYIAEAKTPPELIRVQGNLTTGHLKFCAETGDIAVHGNATLSNQTDTCGTLSAANTVTNSSQAADCSGHGITCGHGTDTEGIAFPVAANVQVPSAAASEWYTWSSSCNFYIDASGLYFWNAGDAGCASYGGGPPAPDGVSSPGDCWIPLIYVVAGAPDNPLQWPEVNDLGGNAEWLPGGGTTSTAGLPTVLPASGPMASRSFPAAQSHPPWTSCVGATPFDWRPPNGAAGGSTSPACNCTGTRASTFNGGSFNFNPADPGAVPAGVYFINGNHNFGTSGLGLPGSDANEGDWPQATILVNGNATFSGQGRIGIGTRRGTAVYPALPEKPVVPAIEYPSLVVSGSLTVGAGAAWAFGGAVWVGQNATFANGSNVEIYGPLSIGQNLTVGTGGKLEVVVSTEMVKSLEEPVAVAATGSRTLR